MSESAAWVGLLSARAHGSRPRWGAPCKCPPRMGVLKWHPVEGREGHRDVADTRVTPRAACHPLVAVAHLRPLQWDLPFALWGVVGVEPHSPFARRQGFEARPSQEPTPSRATALCLAVPASVLLVRAPLCTPGGPCPRTLLSLGAEGCVSLLWMFPLQLMAAPMPALGRPLVFGLSSCVGSTGLSF